MSELYHIKKKNDKGGFEVDQPNPFKTGNGKTIGSAMSSLETLGKKAKNTIDRMQSSSDYQKVKLAQQAKKSSSSNNQPLVSKVGSSISKLGSTVSNKSQRIATSAKAAKKLDDMKTYADESEKDIMDNPPKKLRKKLNPTKLKEIVGPKRR